MNNIAACGLDCGSCEARIATVNNDNELRKAVADKWAKMNNCPDITAETINCMGCMADGVKFYFCGHLCEIRKCAIAKGYQGCWDCADKNSCEKVTMIINHNEEARKRVIG